MDSKPDVRPRPVLIAAAILLAAAGFYWTYGLFPIWELAWLTPLPILWLAPRLSARAAAGAAFIAMALARFDMWSYYRLLHLPLGLMIAAVVMPSAVFAFAISLYRSFLGRGRPILAVLAFPATIVSYEYLFSLWQGTFGNTAYTQLRDLPVLQLAALTGIWGISDLVGIRPRRGHRSALRPRAPAPHLGRRPRRRPRRSSRLRFRPPGQHPAQPVHRSRRFR